MTPLELLPVRFLFTMEAVVNPPIQVRPGPQGDRMILSISSGRFVGPELSGEVLAGAGAEWATVRPDGSIKADVRLVLETEDGANILMTYNGIARVDIGGLKVRTAPLFETGDARYAWLNLVQAVGLGTPTPTGASYDVYEIR